MADISTIVVAAITASAALFGAAISPLSTTYQNVRQAERDRRERRATELRQACTDLLATVTELRTNVVNNLDYHGPEMNARLAHVRQLAGQARTYAFTIALLAPHPLAVAGTELAAAADDVAKAAAANTDLSMGSCVRPTDCAELDARTDAFCERAVALPRELTGGT
jgi:hypothetical protein